MPIHFTIDHKARYVEATFDGHLVLKDLRPSFPPMRRSASAAPWRSFPPPTFPSN
jgi:hypothetical protein